MAKDYTNTVFYIGKDDSIIYTVLRKDAFKYVIERKIFVLGINETIISVKRSIIHYSKKYLSFLLQCNNVTIVD